MPGFHINRKTSFAFAASLVYIAGGIVKNAQHGDNAVGGPVGAGNIRACGPYVMD